MRQVYIKETRIYMLEVSKDTSDLYAMDKLLDMSDAERYDYEIDRSVSISHQTTI